MLAEMGNPLPASSSVSLQMRMHYVLTELEHHNQPTVILLDNAESLLSELGTLASCWQEFLAAFLRAQHQARILLATKEWPGWPGRERVFVSEFTVPLLSVPTSVTLLQRLGLERVPLEHLRAISEQVGGTPLCLEWVATLVQDALSFDDWHSFDPGGIAFSEQTEGEAITGRLLRLLEDPSLLRGHFANKLQPLLERIIDKRLIELQAWLFGAWCDYTEEQGEKRTSQKLREQAIVLYKQCVALHSIHEEQSFLKSGLAKTRLARCSNALSYYLMRDGQYEEALQSVEQSIVLREQGYLDFGGLAVSYGEKSEILTELGRFQEALLFNEKAQTEIQRLANVGYPHAQAETWMYIANRGRLYLRMGKIDEAEQLLREAIPYISKRRRVYRMFAEEALEEIKQWRQRANTPHHQLDWRWVERYRQLASFDSYWWLASAGTFSQEEQRQWNQMYTPDIDETTKEQLSIFITQTRQREIEAALSSPSY
jgi:tetratricopeptide (TPR) repeat protein